MARYIFYIVLYCIVLDGHKKGEGDYGGKDLWKS